MQLVRMNSHTPPTHLIVSVSIQARLHPLIFSEVFLPEVFLPEVVFPESVRPGGIWRDDLQYLRKETEHRRGGRGGAREEKEVMHRPPSCA